MPVLKDLEFAIDMNAVFIRQGFKDPSKMRPGMKEMAEILLDEVKAGHFIRTAVAYEVYPVIGVDSERIALEGGAVLAGPLLPSRFSSASSLVIMVSTIGPQLETRVKDYTNAKETLKGMLLDGIGSAAMHSFTQEACAVVSRSLASDGIEVSRPLSPGMEGFPLSEQAEVLRLAGAQSIGVTLTSSGIMVPRKSTSRVMGIGTQMKIVVG